MEDKCSHKRRQADRRGARAWPGFGDAVGRLAATATLALVLAGFSAIHTQSARAQAPSKYETDLQAFFQELDRAYPFFDLKGIRAEWAMTKNRLLQKVKTCRSDQEFLGIVVEACKSLRDSHLSPRGFKVDFPSQPPRYYPGISFLPATNNRVVVMYPPRELAANLKTGTVVMKIDGQDARAYLEARAKQAWDEGGFFSSPQRARLYEYRIALRGEKQGEKHTITALVGGQPRDFQLASTLQARGWPHVYNMPEGLKREGRSSFYGQLPSGVGYIYLRRVDGSVVPGIQKALAAYPRARGWIIDLRGNGGGGYGSDLHEQLKRIPRPVACVIDAGCMSAGETLARDVVNLCQARLFGSKTAGASSAKRVWQFPSGVGSMVIPRRSRWGLNRQPIEYKGIEPHEAVEAVPEELQQGLNSGTVRAERFLTEGR